MQRKAVSQSNPVNQRNLSAHTTLLPDGEYICHTTYGRLRKDKRNRKDFYEVTYTVIEGPHKGRSVWRHHHLSTQKSRHFSKHELAKLGIKGFKHLAQAVPKCMLCKVQTRNVKDKYKRVWTNVIWVHVIKEVRE